MGEKFIKNAFSYCRVSTPKQAQEGEGLTDQEDANRFVAARLKANILPDGKAWSEPFSGSADSRPVFDEMMKAIKNATVKIDYLIIRDISRLTRGGAASYQKINDELAKYGCEIVDSYGIIQPVSNTLAHLGVEYGWSKFSPSDMAVTLSAESAKDEKRKILTRLMGAEILMTREGWHIGRPDDGFKNDKMFTDGKKKPIEVPNPERAHYYVEMFNLRALGKYSDEEIVEKINAMGFKTREFNLWDKSHTKTAGKRGGIPLSVKQLQRVIQKPIYCGYKCLKWTEYKPVKAKFDGLVSVKLFNKANNGKVFIKEDGAGNAEILYNCSTGAKVTKRRNSLNPLFPYKEFVKCAYCGKPFLGSTSPGKSKKGFPTYHCGRGHKYFGKGKKEFESVVEGFIRSLDYNTDTLEALKIAQGDTYSSRSEQIAVYKEKVENNVVSIEQEQTKVFDMLKETQSSILRRKLEEDYEKLEKEKELAKKQEPDTGINQYDIKNFFSYAEYLMGHHEELLLNKDNQLIQRRLLTLVCDEVPTYEEILNGTPKISFMFGKNKELASASSLNVGNA